MSSVSSGVASKLDRGRRVAITIAAAIALGVATVAAIVFSTSSSTSSSTSPAPGPETVSPATSAIQAPSFDTVCTAQAPRLETRGTDLLVDGRPRFSVMVSYFDVMRASEAAIERDFSYLKSTGIDGVRVFPLWIRGALTPGGERPEATLLDPSGAIRNEERWAHFAMALAKAARCGFIVDVTFNRDMLDGIEPFSVAAYRGDPRATPCAGGRGAGAGGLTEVACRIRRLGYRNILIDIQNERNVGPESMALSFAELKSIRDAIEQVAPEQLVMVSHGGGNIADAVAAARTVPLDIVAYHAEQRRGWYEQTAAEVAALHAAGRPVYIQEGARTSSPSGDRDDHYRGVDCDLTKGQPNPFILAMLAARDAGAVAWTFHTDAAFRLDVQSFQDQIAACPAEVDFLNRLTDAWSKSPRVPRVLR